MKYKHFKRLIEILKKQNELFHELSQLGFDFLENERFPIWENNDHMFMAALESHYTDEGIDWISWFIYDNDFGKGGMNAMDNGKPICQDIKSLHEYIKQYKR